MRKITFSIQEFCQQFITPAVEKSGWDRELQISFCEDVDFAYAQLNTEYVLLYKPNIPVAVISVTENDTEIDAGIEKAVENAKKLDIPCAFSSNGNGFLFYNRTKPPKYAETELDLENFPTPEQLWAIYLNYKNAKTVTEETAKAVKNGKNRLLLGVAAVGVGFVATVFQIIKGVFETKTGKRALYLTDKDDYWKNKEWDYWRNETSEDFRTQPQSNHYQNQITPLNQMSANHSAGIYYASVQDLSAKNTTPNYKQFPSDFFDVIIVDKSDNKNSINPKEWQEPLEYFKNATQIAVTPQEKISESDVGYFGKPTIIDISKRSLDNGFPVFSSTKSAINQNENNLHIENNTHISTNNNTVVSNSTNNNYTNEGDTTIISKTESYHTEINHNKTIINNTIMARQTSFSHQIELAEELKRYLHGFQERLGVAAQNYQSKCNNLYEAGMMDEKHQDLEGYMHATINGIKNVVQQINEADIPFIERYIKYLEESRSVK